MFIGAAKRAELCDLYLGNGAARNRPGTKGGLLFLSVKPLLWRAHGTMDCEIRALHGMMDLRPPVDFV